MRSILILTASLLMLASCVAVPVGPRYYGGGWVPGHYSAAGFWVPGHWRG